MTTHLRFGSTDRPTGELVNFDVSGWDYLTDEAFTETFTCLPEPPAGLLDDYLAHARVVNGRRTLDQFSIRAFLRGCVVPADEARIDALFDSKARTVRLQLLAEIVVALVETFTNRPTTP